MREWVEQGSIVASVDPLDAKAEQSKLGHLLVDAAETAASQFNQTVKVIPLLLSVCRNNASNSF